MSIFTKSTAGAVLDDAAQLTEVLSSSVVQPLKTMWNVRPSPVLEAKVQQVEAALSEIESCIQEKAAASALKL